MQTEILKVEEFNANFGEKACEAAIDTFVAEFTKRERDFDGTLEVTYKGGRVERGTYVHDRHLVKKINSRKYFLCNHFGSYDTVTIKKTKKEKKSVHISSYAEFKKHFDLNFITEEGIIQLWEGGSGQNASGKWRRNDFRYFPKRSKAYQVMQRFLKRFAGIGKYNEFYTDSHYTPGDKIFEMRDGSRDGVHGRDISVSHQWKGKFVYWSSEYPGCGNGGYSIVVGPNKILFCEYD